MALAEDIRPPEMRLGPLRERMEPLWDRVDRNRIKLAFTVALFVVGCVLGIDLFVVIIALPFLLFTSLVDAHGDGPRLLAAVLGVTSALAFGAGGAWTAVALSRSERWLVRRLGAAIIPKGEELPTKFALKDMALAAGFAPAPALYVLETSNVNAFVFAASRRRPIVGVTRGLLSRLSIDEQRAVFANLVARLRSGDTIHATGVTALTRPLWYARETQLRNMAEEDFRAMPGGRTAAGERADTGGNGALAIGWVFFVAAAFVAITEVAAFGSRRSQLSQAEVADAEGMLLLKDPKAMLAALESCIRYDNVVPTAGPAFAQLFYCWTGDSTNDEEDPEWRRVIRLREVLGVEGIDVPDDQPSRRPMPVPPAAPCLGRGTEAD